MSEWITSHGGIEGLGARGALLVLIAFSIVSIGVMIERAWTLRRVRASEESDYQTLRAALRAKQGDTVRDRARTAASPVAAALRAGLDASDLGEARMSEAIEQEVSMQSAELGRNLPVLATIASIAPYVGLFGTVLGILGAFGRIAQTGQTGARVVAAPISEALVATALGLGVAIPAVMAYNYFSGRVNALGLQVEDHALELSARLPAVLALESAVTAGSVHEDR
ncbi:MAG TPA: MotA/TolQ/ExbB proton channel family protein [Abditibacteriaceae bacterium]|jgi:biopolymer transport protein ExbB/TolQ